MIDFNTEIGRQVLHRLHEEQIFWLTTVTADGTPQPNPVWFIWEDGTFLIYTQPSAYRLKNIARNPRVSVNLQATPDGGEVVVFTGQAYIDTNAPPVAKNQAYVEKYAQGIRSIDMTPESMSASYSVPLRIRPEKMRTF